MKSSGIVDLTRVPPEGVAIDHPFPPEVFFDPGDGVTASGPVEFSVQVRRTSVGFTLRGRIVLTARLECGRCLGTYESQMKGDFTLEYRPRPDSFAEEVHIRREDLDLAYLGEGEETLNLHEIAREQALLMVPMKPLCRPDCRGLCPGCGADRNRVECQCAQDSPDPRLSPLAALRRRTNT